MKTIKVINSDKEIGVGKILCLGRNYQEHAKEMKADVPAEPIIFIKPSTAIIADQDDIIFPRISKDLHHEVELVVAIGKDGKNINQKEALDYVLGYGIGLDMTLRDVQSEAKKHGLPWTIAKGFDTSAAVSRIIPKDRISDPHDLVISCSVNGIIRQKSSTNNMIFRIEKTIEYISNIFTLEVGDLIYTGTPEGVGSVKPGDTITAELEGYISISHTVRKEKE